jgi:hypothetical protein
MLGIAAEPIPRLGRAERAPKITLGIKGLQRLLRGYVAEAMPASLTAVVLEIESLSAVLALEKLHGTSCMLRVLGDGRTIPSGGAYLIGHSRECSARAVKGSRK